MLHCLEQLGLCTRRLAGPGVQLGSKAWQLTQRLVQRAKQHSTPPQMHHTTILALHL